MTMFATLGIIASFGDLPSAWDWRNVNGSNWLNPVQDGAVRDQLHVPPAAWGGYYTGHCDCCWAFSSMDVLSARIYIKSNQTIKALPATNFLYDCMPGLKSCGYPGDASQAYNFLANGTFADGSAVFGAPDESCTPVAASLGGNAQHCEGNTPCAGKCTRVTMCRNRTDGGSGSEYTGRLYGVRTWRYMGQGTTAEEIQAELLHGPMAAGMCVNKNWTAYNHTRGVLAASEGTACNHINHDVNYVGWGSDPETGMQYWLIRNSFGKNWGEGGYFRIERGKNAFLIESHIRAPDPSWTS